jgi:hypothetical protein
MKKVVIAVTAVSLALGFSSLSLAASDIQGDLSNKATVKESANVAIGKGSTANMGSMAVKNSNVKGTVTNKANIEKSANVAIGENVTANMGAVTMQDANVEGDISATMPK